MIGVTYCKEHISTVCQKSRSALCQIQLECLINTSLRSLKFVFP